MRKFYFPLFVFLLFVYASPATGASLEAGAVSAVCIVDDAGRAVRLEKHAVRIIPLYAAFTDMLDAIGQKHRIIAHTKADVHSGLDALPVVGTHMRPNIELVIGLKPDLVLQMGGRAEAAQSVFSLEAHGIPTAFFQVRSFAELYSVIERIGILTGTESAADAAIMSMRKKLDTIAATVALARKARPTVFFEVRYPNLLAAGPDSIITDIIRMAGGRNVLVADDTPEYFTSVYKGRVVRLGEEELLRLGPNWYLVQSGPMNKNPVALTARPHYTTLKAVKEQRVHVVDEHIFSRPGPRSVEAVALLARLLYPHLFPDSSDPVQESK